MRAQDGPLAAGTRSKLTLFCPSCDRRGRADAAWHYERVEDDTVTWKNVITCPECGAVVARF